MNLCSLLSNYKPYDQHEKADFDSFNQFFKLFDKDMWAVRDNKIGHLTASALILNKDRTKMLMGYHNIYKSWSWFGGHADGDLNLYNVCLKELEEETGINKNKFKQIYNNDEQVIDFSVIAVGIHSKKGQIVSEHLHYNVSYLFEVDEQEPLNYRDDEHSGIAWININDFFNKSEYKDTEIIMNIYKRIIEKSGIKV